jgi:chorismate synthase
MRVAIGSLARQFLEYFSIYSYSHVIGIGSILIDDNTIDGMKKKLSGIKEIKEKINRSRVYCLEEKISEEMCIEIDGAKKEGDTLGGVFEVVIGNVPVGLGSHVSWARRIDARIAKAIMSIPSVKAIEIGRGMRSAQSRGSQAQDAIYYEKAPELKNSNKSNFYRKQNWAGGIEGGITNGEEITVRAYLKPIPTLSSPLPSVNLRSKKESPANYQRSDCCVVPAASVIGEAAVNWETATAFLEKFAGDSLKEIKENFNNYQKRIKDC